MNWLRKILRMIGFNVKVEPKNHNYFKHHDHNDFLQLCFHTAINVRMKESFFRNNDKSIRITPVGAAGDLARFEFTKLLLKGMGYSDLLADIKKTSIGATVELSFKELHGNRIKVIDKESIYAAYNAYILTLSSDYYNFFTALKVNFSPLYRSEFRSDLVIPSLYLDDERDTPEDYSVRVFRASDCINLIKNVPIRFMSLDHDLGNDANGTGYDVMLALEKAIFTDTLGYPIPQVICHSANPAGRKNMEAAMRSIDRKR